MTILILYVAVALLFSFLCSIAEAVLLRVTTAHIRGLEQEGRISGSLLRELKGDINKPLAAILTLNTIAHTVGAVGAGAQAVLVFGNAWVGLFSAILTLMILVFSEIIPKTLGATYWRALAGVTAQGLRFLIKMLYPFVVLSELLTRGISRNKKIEGFNREEFAAMAELGEQEGQLEERESRILKNMFRLHETIVTDVMTPRPVVFSLPESLTVYEYFDNHYDSRFSRIPVYAENDEMFTGFVLKDDLLLAQARNNTDNKLESYRRNLHTLSDKTSLSDAFDEVLHQRAHIMVIIDEYGGMEGIITMEDILETLLGLEIMDESDKTADMQQYARRMWKKRAQAMGITLPKDEDSI
ncbi:MAG: HlyC/CorC family transporter [Gammaproteobacteria bacterium]|uniref:HlyC/CorC family transporter n=1 Tax=Candidatus Thiopontia autotrophica TaxID=2841688 RepID=A0A8J6P8Z2_9GAMM|nr:HlyC/CorC family transporter [Candidatus Thiopontia autotrophica]